jgi:hypothetical protein
MPQSSNEGFKLGHYREIVHLDKASLRNSSVFPLAGLKNRGCVNREETTS